MNIKFTTLIPMCRLLTSRWQYCLIPCLLLLHMQAWAQNVRVSGKITDENNQGLPGVNVLVSGESTGTISDVEGNYSIQTQKGATLTYSFVGYLTQTVEVGDNTTINITMSPDIAQLEEVIVTGYTSQRKQDITGAVSVVDAEQLNQISAPSFTQKLEGRASGLTISTSGEPGEGTNVRIRGISSFQNNDPLYIIDGVPVQDAFNTGFNPNDIESIQVLKDASAASIYGARANNGVIIVTTKKGRPGKVNINYNAYFGLATAINDTDYLIKDPVDYSNVVWNAHENADVTIDDSNPYSLGRGVLPTYTYPFPNDNVDESNYSYPDNLIFKANHAGTDWFDAAFRTAPVTEHNLGVSGGGDNGSYYFSAGYLNQQGTMIHNFFERFSVRANTEFKLGKFTIGENYSLTRSNSVGQDNVGGGNQDEQGIMTWITLMHPLTPVYDISGEHFAGDKANGMSNGNNPVAELVRNKNNEGTFNRILGNVFAEVEIIDNLTARTSFGTDFSNNFTGSFDFPAPENRQPNATNGWSEQWRNNFSWTWTNTLVYSATLGQSHKLQALAGYEAIRGRFRNISGSINNFFTQDINAWYVNGGLADPETRQVNSSGSFNSLASFFGKLDYDFGDRYLLSFTIRRDGSSNFGDEKYGVFPAFSAGWRISNEAFMENIAWLEDLKLRFGWGVTGNQNVPGGNAFDRFGGGTASTFYDINGTNNSLVTGYALINRGNRSTKWEENISSNIGLDATLFAGRLNIVADVYTRTVDGLLFPAELPGTAGTAAPAYVNIAKMENNGVDLSLDYNNRVNSDFGYNVGITFSQYRNEVVSIDGAVESFFPTGFDSRIGTVNVNRVGSSISSFYGYTADGIFRSQSEVDAHAQQDGKAVGRIRFKDLDNDGVINDNDKGVIGDPHPDFNGGLNLGVSYKNFDLSIFLFGSVGNQLFNYNKLFDTFRFFNSNVRKEVLTNSFHPTDNPDGDLPMLDVLDVFSYQPSSFYVEDASYLRAKNIQLGYNFPAGFLDHIFTNLRLYVQAQNLFTITNYSGLDPAPSNFSPSGGLNGDLWNGFDLGNYPANKMFMVGLNVGF